MRRGTKQVRQPLSRLLNKGSGRSSGNVDRRRIGECTTRRQAGVHCIGDA
jgi:hypothetical protein